MAPWIRRLFADLVRAESADFYRCVGAHQDKPLSTLKLKHLRCRRSNT